MDRDEALDVLATLSDSTHRISILQYLDDGESRVADVSGDLDVPRATVKHNLQRLEEAGLIRSVGSGYSITTYGERVCEDVTDCLDRIVVSKRLLPFLEAVPETEALPPLAALREATVTEVSPTNPHAPVERLLATLEDASYLRIVTPVLLPRVAEVLFEGIVEDDLRVDLVCPAPALASATESHGEAYRDALDTERLIVGKDPDPVPFGLFRFEERVALMGHDEENIPRCLVESTAPAVLSWADDRFGAYERSVEARDWHDAGE